MLEHRARRNAGSIRFIGPVLGLLLTTSLLAACGAPARDVATGARPAGNPGRAAPQPPAPSAVATSPPSAPAPAPAPASGSGRASPTLPTLPPVQSRTPERFDASGCLRTSPTASDCAQRAPQLDASAAGRTTADWRTLAGFVGSQYTTDLTRDAVVVLSDTVTTSAGPRRWRAVGLARNEHARTIAAITIEATLRDSHGNVLETAVTTSPVGAIRPGEPVPFDVSASQDTTTGAAVASVTWRTTELAGPADETYRRVEVNTFWTRPWGDDRAVAMYLHEDAGGARPYLLFGSLTAHAAVNRPHVVLAWMSPDGRVLAVRDVDVAAPDASAAVTLAPASAGDFLVVVDDPVEGRTLSDTGPMLWGAGR